MRDCRLRRRMLNKRIQATALSPTLPVASGGRNWATGRRPSAGIERPGATRMPKRGNNRKSGHLGICIAMGIAIGAAFGIALDNLAMGIGPGIALGIAISLAISGRPSGKSPEDARGGEDRDGG